MDAKNNQVNSTRTRREVSTTDIPVGQQAAVNLELPRTSDEIEAVDIPLDLTDMEALAFNEEPVKIVIQKSSEKFAPNVVDCWVNGRGAEQLQNGKWMVCGWLPVGIPVITKRKYVEVLLRAKPDSVQTQVVQHAEHEDNFAHRYTSNKYPLSILQDNNPRAAEWLTKIQMEG